MYIFTDTTSFMELWIKFLFFHVMKINKISTFTSFSPQVLKLLGGKIQTILDLDSRRDLS